MVGDVRVFMEFGNLKSVFNLHVSPEASYSVGRHRQQGERIPNTPRDILSTYLGDLAASHSLFNNALEDYPERRDGQIRARLISADMVPVAQIERVRNAAQGEVMSDEEIVANIQLDQRESLQNWIDYLSDTELVYPEWFKYYVYRSVFQMSKYDIARKKFATRNKHTVTAYPELNQEALASVYEQMLANPKEQRSFAVLYAEAINTVTSHEIYGDSIAGEWVKYARSDDIDDAHALSSTLQGKNTTWCTAYTNTAHEQLKYGDFYVYYAYDKEGTPSVPRIAIRMSGNRIGEIRGVRAHQSVEYFLYDTLYDKLAEFEGTEEYLAKIDACQRDFPLSGILEHDAAAALTREQLATLYSLDEHTEAQKQPWLLQHAERARYRRPYEMSLESELGISSRTKQVLRAVRPDARADADALLPNADILERAVRMHSKVLFDDLLEYAAGKYTNDDALVADMAQYGEKRTANLIAANLLRFTSLGNKAASLLITNGQHYTIYAHPDRFTALNPGFLNEYAKTGNLDPFLTVGYDSFEGGFDAMLDSLMKTNLHTTASAIMRCIDRMPPMKFDIAQRLVNAGHGKFVYAHLDHFPEIDNHVGRGRAQVSRLRKSKQPVKLIRLVQDEPSPR